MERMQIVHKIVTGRKRLKSYGPCNFDRNCLKGFQLITVCTGSIEDTISLSPSCVIK